MPQHGRDPAWGLGFQRFMGGWANARRAGSTSRRRCRGQRFLLGIDQLETRTLLSLPAVAGPTPAPAPSSATSTAQVTFNLQLQPGSAQALSQLMPLLAAEGATVAPTTISGLYSVQAPTATMGQLAQDLSTNPAVEYADSVRTFQTLTVPNDPDYVNGDQWQLNGTWGVNAPAAWSVTTGSDGVIVADVDTGLNYNLPDIYDNVWLNQPEIPTSVIGNLTDVYKDGAITFNDLNNSVNQGSGKIEDTNGDGIITGADVLASTSVGGWVDSSAPNTQDGATANPDDFIGWNFVNNTNNPIDDQGHGTFTASEIGEMTNNTVGGAGLVWNTQLMPVEFLDSTGSGTDTAAAQAIDYAVNHGAKVINASWGGTGTDPTVEAAIKYADENGVIIVAAAGNDGADDDTTFFSPASYSAQYSNVISVAAIGSNGLLASFSDYGVGTVQLAAPGVNVYSTLSSGSYGTMSGTSMAAPMVTGTMALVEAAHPTWTMSQVIDAVLDTVTPDPSLAGKVATGGVVNAGAAVANTDGPYVVSATPDGSINSSGGLSTVQLTFNEEINPATLTSAQVTLTGPGGVIAATNVTPVAGSNDHEFAVSFPAQTAAGTYTLKVGPGCQDWYGNDMNQNRNSVNGEAADAFTETIRLTAPGSTDLLSITGVPTVTPANISETFTVTALSPNGGTDTGYVGTINFTSTDPQAVLPASFPFTAANDGTHTFTVTFKTAGSQAITATDTSNPAIIGTQENFTVTPATAQSLKVTGFPTTVTAGAPQTFTVTAYDTYGNVATGYTGTLHFTSTDSQAVLPANYTITPEDQGTFSFAATLETLGSQSITATDTTTSSIKGTESGITVVAAVPSFKVTGFPTADTAGASASVTVTAYTAAGIVATGYSGTVILTSSDPKAALTPDSYTFTGADAGTHTFLVTLESAGAQSITATDSVTTSMTGSEAGIIVQPAAAQSLVIAGFPTTDTAGVAHNVTLTAYDAYGNVATSYTGTVVLSSSDGLPVLPAGHTFTGADAGTHSFSVALDSAGTQESIAATDSFNSSLSDTESGVTVQAAALAKLVVAGFPANPTAGTAFSFTVSATDAYGNLITGYQGTVNLSSSDPNVFFQPSSYTFKAGDLGTHTFTATLKTAGPQSIKASDTTNNISGTQAGVTVQAAALAKLVVTGFPATEIAGAAETFTVSATDAYGNVTTGYQGTVNLSSSDPNVFFQLTSYTFVTADLGTHIFTAKLETAGPQSIKASDTTNNISGTETGITVQAAGAQSLKVTGYPTNPIAGTAYTVTVAAYDPFNNVATGYRGTLALSSSDGHAVLPPNYTFTAADPGTHSFSVTLETAGTQSIAATDTTTSSITGSESNIAVSAAAAKTLSVAGFPTPDTAGASGAVIVTAHDAYGNVATSYTGTVAFFSSDGHAVLPSDFIFTASDAGTHSFPVTLDTAGTQSIAATDTTTSSITGSETTIVVNAAAAKTLSIAGFPTTETAGAANTVSVTAFDAYGNVATGYTGTLALSSSDGHAVLPAEYTFISTDAGKHSFSVTLETAGTQSITATDTLTTSLTTAEDGIAVQAATAKTLAVTGFPTTDTAGTSASVTVTAYDAYGNVATGYTGTLTLSSSEGAAVLAPEHTFTVAEAGSYRFSVTLDTAGTQSIAATDTTTSSITGTESNIVVNPAAAKTLSIAGFPTTDTAGAANTVSVIAFDAYGNVATGYTGTLALSSSDGHVVLPADYTFISTDAGKHSFSVTLETAGTQSITATDTLTTSLTASEDGIAVQAAAARTLAVTGFPTTNTAGTANTVTVTAYDAYGNVANGYTGTVALSSSAGHAVLPPDFIFNASDAGTHSFSVTVDTAGTQLITATDILTTSITGSETAINVQPAAAHSLTVTGFPTTDTAGAANTVIVTAHDAYGNVATGYAGTVAYSSSDGHAILPAGYTFTDQDAGTHSFSVTLKSAGPQTITVDDVVSNTITGTQSGIVVNPAAPSVLVLSGYPSLTTAGVGQSFKVTAQDPYGNIATGYTGTIQFQSSDGQDTAGAGLPINYTFTTGAGQDNGVHLFSAALKTAGTQSITAFDNLTHTITGTQSGIVVSPAAASKVVFGQPPTATTAGAAIGPAVTVDVVDAYGNVVTGYSSTVSLTLNGGTFEGGSNTVFGAESSGVATFSGLKIDIAGNYTISATDQALAPSGASNSFAIRPATATQLVIQNQPSATATAGQAFGNQPVIALEDRFGNLETLDGSSVVSASPSNGTGPLQGTIIATLSGGVATFTNLADDTAQTISVTFKSGSLSPVTSNGIHVNPAAATQLVVTTPPPDPLVAGQAFTVVVSSEDPYGNVEPTYNGNVTISVPSDPGFTTTVQAKNGVAAFVGLILPATADTETVRAVATGLSAAVTSPLNVTSIVPAPTILGEYVVTMRKENKKGKPVGKSVFVGFALQYSAAMDPASAGVAANYSVVLTTKKRVKKKLETTFRPVAFSSAYDSSTNTVTLTIIKGAQQFAQGGQISVTASPPNGVASAAGVPLNASDTIFTVTAKAKRITPG